MLREGARRRVRVHVLQDVDVAPRRRRLGRFRGPWAAMLAQPLQRFQVPVPRRRCAQLRIVKHAPVTVARQLEHGDVTVRRRRRARVDSERAQVPVLCDQPFQHVHVPARRRVHRDRGSAPGAAVSGRQHELEALEVAIARRRAGRVPIPRAILGAQLLQHGEVAVRGRQPRGAHCLRTVVILQPLYALKVPVPGCQNERGGGERAVLVERPLETREVSKLGGRVARVGRPSEVVRAQPPQRVQMAVGRRRGAHARVPGRVDVVPAQPIRVDDAARHGNYEAKMAAMDYHSQFAD